MSTWILILTLIGPFQKDGAAITAIEFTNKESCISAGNAWLKKNKSQGYHSKTAICVQK